MSVIKLVSEINHDEYTKYICDNYDLFKSETIVEEIEYDFSELENFDWNIGLIYGSSGSGKTTILKKLGDVYSPQLNSKIPLISNFTNVSPQQATELLIQIGISSIPTLLKPYNVLSNGEKYRADLAFTIYNAKKGETILIDEYTSVVNRDVAKAMSHTLQKYIRKHNLKIVLSSCHYDIFEWLKPDWTYSPQIGGHIERCDCLRQRPNINLTVCRCEPEVWKYFKKHHYLTQDLNKSAKCFLFELNNQPVAFAAIIAQPSGSYKNGWRESRIVVLPDFQGIGIGVLITEFLGGIFKNNDCRYFTKTIHPKLGNYRTDNPNWLPTAKNGKILTYAVQNTKLNKNAMIRKSFCFEYIGEKIKGCDDLLLPINELRKK